MCHLHLFDFDGLVREIDQKERLKSSQFIRVATLTMDEADEA